MNRKEANLQALRTGSHETTWISEESPMELPPMDMTGRGVKEFAPAQAPADEAIASMITSIKHALFSGQPHRVILMPRSQQSRRTDD